MGSLCAVMGLVEEVVVVVVEGDVLIGLHSRVRSQGEWVRMVCVCVCVCVCVSVCARVLFLFQRGSS